MNKIRDIYVSRQSAKSKYLNLWLALFNPFRPAHHSLKEVIASLNVFA